MEEFVPLDMSPRKKGAMEWAKEKVKEADFVAVGVNVVVGALLIGGLVGAILAPSGGSAPDVNAAALNVRDDTTGNSTARSPGDESVGKESDKFHDGERERDPDD